MLIHLVPDIPDIEGPHPVVQDSTKCHPSNRSCRILSAKKLDVQRMCIRERMREVVRVTNQGRADPALPIDYLGITGNTIHDGYSFV